MSKEIYLESDCILPPSFSPAESQLSWTLPGLPLSPPAGGWLPFPPLQSLPQTTDRMNFKNQRTSLPYSYLPRASCHAWNQVRVLAIAPRAWLDLAPAFCPSFCLTVPPLSLFQPLLPVCWSSDAPNLLLPQGLCHPVSPIFLDRTVIHTANHLFMKYLFMLLKYVSMTPK